MKCIPRVLIISNECLSNISSNGRTLRNFLVGWPKEKLAQFCIRNNFPDFSICDNYYFVSDRAALDSFLRGNQAGKRLHSEEKTDELQLVSSRKRRNAVTMMLRDTVWNSMRWAGNDFWRWIEGFSPELILLQAGDCAFMLRLTRKLAEKYHIPVVIYNSEAYYFKEFDYFRSEGIAKRMYPLFHKLYCKEFEKTIRKAEKSIYCCEKLKQDYDARFELPSEVVFTATQLASTEESPQELPLRISYLGNLGVGRHEGLIDIGNELQRISPNLKVEVYGKLPNKDVEMAFSVCKGIEYKGFIPYDDVKKVIQNSDILIHTESFDAFYREDLKYAFSTKIADSLASGRCFLLYAPKELACAEYLINHNAAYVVTEQELLGEVLAELCQNPSKRRLYIENALKLAKDNHSVEKNAARFQQVLCESVYDLI